MNKILLGAAIAAMLIVGVSRTGLAASGQHGAGRSGSSRGMAVHASTPRASGSRRPGGPPVGMAVPRSGSGRPIPYYGSRYGLPFYGAYAGALGAGLYAYDDPLWYGADAYGDGYPYPYGPADPYEPPGAYETGGLRLDMTPKSAEVIVDGHQAGIVDDFDGRFEHLDLVPGAHHVEVRAPGYTPVQFDVSIAPNHTIKYRGTLVKP